jgi:hypothetical protein
MDTKEFLDKRLKESKSIAKFASGFYVSRGGTHGFDIKIAIFGMKLFPMTAHCIDSKVLIEAFNEMFWINLNSQDIFVDSQNLHLDSQTGEAIRLKLEAIKM